MCFLRFFLLLGSLDKLLTKLENRCKILPRRGEIFLTYNEKFTIEVKGLVLAVYIQPVIEDGFISLVRRAPKNVFDYFVSSCERNFLLMIDKNIFWISEKKYCFLESQEEKQIFFGFTEEIFVLIHQKKKHVFLNHQTKKNTFWNQWKHFIVCSPIVCAGVLHNFVWKKYFFSDDPEKKYDFFTHSLIFEVILAKTNNVHEKQIRPVWFPHRQMGGHYIQSLEYQLNSLPRDKNTQFLLKQKVAFALGCPFCCIKIDWNSTQSWRVWNSRSRCITDGCRLFCAK